MIYDCFMFSDELDMLELRLHELGSVVDRFLFVEALETFTGQSKPAVLGDAMQAGRFAEWGDRLSGITIHKLPPGTPWEREAAQRNAIADMLRGVAKPGDLILVSDVDEIPRAVSVREALATTERNWAATVAFAQTMYFYDPTCHNLTYWVGTRAVRYGAMHSPQSLRATQWSLPTDVMLPNAGWHWSYFMSPDAIRRKVAAYSHTEVNQPQFTNEANIREAMETCRSLCPGDGQVFERVEPHDLPAYMLRFPEKYGLVREAVTL